MSDGSTPAYLNVHSGERTLFIWFHQPVLIDSLMVTEVGNQLFAAQDARPDLHVLISFAGIQGVSSAMLGKLITLNRRAQRAGRKLVLCEMESVVHEMFSSSRLTDYFTILSGRAAAAQAVNGWLNETRDDILPPA